MSERKWERLEFAARAVDLSGGLEARIADPLWMLARQWQVSEFTGDDAAQPAAVRVRVRSVPLATIQGVTGSETPMPRHLPLEAAVESAPAPDAGAAGLHAQARASRRLLRTLEEAGFGRRSAAVQALRDAFPISAPVRLVAFGAAGARVAALLARESVDCASLARLSAADLLVRLGGALDTAAARRLRAAFQAWQAWYRAREGSGSDFAWDQERVEHRFSATAAATEDDAGIRLSAPEHDGTHLDWYTFDLVSQAERTAGVVRALTAIPTPVRYSGMPASRWWEFEDSTVNFGDIDAGPADLARLLVAEFAAAYSDDWFGFPVTVPVGSLNEIVALQVIDNFGARPSIPSTAFSDSTRGADRAWRLFELAGDEVSAAHPSPWLFVPPTVAGDGGGPILERVTLARDEGANLAWAIERVVEGPLGRGVDRADAWHALHGASPRRSSAPRPAGKGEPAEYSEQYWRYRLETPAPPWWIPLVAERLSDRTAEVRLRRARMRAWDLLLEKSVAASQVGPQGVLLDPRRPCWFYEEEVPRAGARFERRWQFARWHDGSFHVWLQRRKLTGRGERSSGLRWDLLEPGEAAGGKPGRES